MQTGAAFRRFRRLRGLKQSHAAELLGVSQATVSRWETGALEPSDDARRAIAALIARHGGEDHALKRLVESATWPVHLICDATHALLAASPARSRQWRCAPHDLAGRSLWRYASDEIRKLEAELPAYGWDMPAGPALAFWTGANRSPSVPIAPGVTLWERLPLSDGRLARLVSTVATPPPHARWVGSAPV
jgi:transcriptional regulator with XRE-family HTH domain